MLGEQEARASDLGVALATLGDPTGLRSRDTARLLRTAIGPAAPPPFMSTSKSSRIFRRYSARAFGLCRCRETNLQVTKKERNKLTAVAVIYLTFKCNWNCWDNSRKCHFSTMKGFFSPTPLQISRCLRAPTLEKMLHWQLQVIRNSLQSKIK